MYFLQPVDWASNGCTSTHAHMKDNPMQSQYFPWLQRLCVPALVVALSACGGGGDASGDDSGSDVGAATATLSVSAAPSALTLLDSASGSLTVTNPGETMQTVSFELGWPAGSVSASATRFSDPCVTSALTVGATSIKATLSIPAKQSCNWSYTKQFNNAGAGQAVAAISLDNVRIVGSLPTFDVTDARIKYAGQWRTACKALSSTTTQDEIVTFTLSGSDRVAFSTIEYGYTSADCSGTATQTDSRTGLMAHAGTKTISGWGEVDKVQLLEANGQPKGGLSVASVRESKAYFTEAKDASVDSDGYPTIGS
jgi:hypothetical protein